MLSRHIGQLALSVSLFGFAIQALATPINYNEASTPSGGGEFQYQFVSPTRSFTLDTGVNTISGTMGMITFAFPDFDGFGFTVPSGLQVDSLSLNFTDAVGN